MAVALNEAALRVFLNTPEGPVGLDLARRARQVEELARQNASGRYIDIRTGDLVGGLHTNVSLEGGLHATVGSDAMHRAFPYPGIVHRSQDSPAAWLTVALEEGFR